ncbi:MAG: hypothetical protein KGZ32_02920 [Dethiobacter sp.]|nr:hypothetical protein [Dethiobacter sp.]
MADHNIIQQTIAVISIKNIRPALEIITGGVSGTGGKIRIWKYYGERWPAFTKTADHRYLNKPVETVANSPGCSILQPFD